LEKELLSVSWSSKEQVPSFAVPNLELAIEFYSRLGFKVEWQWPKSETTHVGLRQGPCALMLTLNEPAERGEIYYVVDDVQGCYTAIIEARPWEVAETSRFSSDREDCPPKRALLPPDAPTVKPHGHEDFNLLDPWGHQLTFGREEVV
jgi:catechol 2,3-dioxygenase-like lactoylglutathione lyase family enzyme